MITNIQFGLSIHPVGYDDCWPHLRIRLNGKIEKDLILKDRTTFFFNTWLDDGKHEVTVELCNKQDSDTRVENDQIVADKALKINEVDIEGYRFDDFKHRATYYPEDRDPIKSDYLGWNGIWRLEFETPIFTWIHQTQNLGWIYGKNV